MSRAASILVVLAACEGGQSPLFDAGPIDPPILTDGGGPCGKESLVEGELVDWDSSTGGFLGVAGATVTLVGDPAITTTTPRDGRLELCARPDLLLRFDIDAPEDYLDASLAFPRGVLQTPGFFPLSLRLVTAARAATFFAELGLVLDPTAAHVVVLLTGDRIDVALDAPHDPPRAADDAGDGVFTWSTGAAGRYVLFPNVDPTAGTATIDAGVAGRHAVTLRPGQLALAVIAFVFI